jgi:hypothetical protein
MHRFQAHLVEFALAVPWWEKGGPAQLPPAGAGSGPEKLSSDGWFLSPFGFLLSLNPAA